MNVSKDGYLFYSDNFKFTELKRDSTGLKPFLKDVPLQPIEIGKKVILRNIFFDFDKYILKPESNAELQKLVQFLTQNSKLKIEIGGHTDKKGTAEYNNQLSTNRAKAVYDYLVEHSIDKKRLSFAGYGFSQPIATNETKEGRALNRRTEFKIVE